ncbi:hypothetical protein IGI04_016984 [Brassica rapa subsp. trilocularis]|uniref:Uncharacterized protein n=1 Tax=Brassica rapa subsp. trilocularis TaxID=1813537 RepID=A0ABQ7MUJ4_BRACM|nr:hypothetical protein IGI04_016984 [Brassica rapa subsp. trilocularis]
MVSDCQPSNPPGPEPAGTNTHYPRTQHQPSLDLSTPPPLAISFSQSPLSTSPSTCYWSNL